ncbi:MAG: carboxypeptidase regulatory-like domain-containing protein [Acidobacteria bacterium]|nr:carboxypeptidase regulatory-like domain-containing protein [Acidobacteriota bacterium]
MNAAQQSGYDGVQREINLRSQRPNRQVTCRAGDVLIRDPKPWREKSMRPRILSVLLLAASHGALAQGRFETGELRGFTKPPTGHIIERLGETPTIRSVGGSVHSEVLRKPLEGVLVEIRGPGATGKIKRTLTNRQGRFRFGRVPDGEYTIKVTLNGFRSVVGTVSVRRSIKETKPLRFNLLHGV